MDSLTLKHNFFQNENNKKSTSFAPRLLIFKLQQEVLKFQWYLPELELPKTDMVTNFSNLEICSFENVSFSP